jgi:hypothetical protein
MILSGTRGKWADGCRQYAEFGHNRYCSNTTGEDLEPGLALLKEEYSIGKIIRLDEQTHKRLADFAIPDETYQDLINRLLEGAGVFLLLLILYNKGLNSYGFTINFCYCPHEKFL